MKILILSFYYPPDLSAGSFRTAALVRQLQAAVPPDSQIDIITTQPNRYHSLAAASSADERLGALRVRRITLPAHHSGMRDQAKAFSVYARAALKLLAGERYDLVYGTSSRLFTAMLAVVAGRKAQAPVYLDIRDIFVDTMKDVLPRSIALPALPVLSLLERFTIRHAARVNLVSAGFLPWFQSRYPRQQFDVHPNGIDDEFLDLLPQPTTPRERAQVLYAGNVGEGQGLHHVLPELAKRCADQFDFVVIGDGGRRAALQAALAAANVSNVTLLPPMPRLELIPAYQHADVLFLHLNSHDAFLKVLPSKLFEYAALGKPVLAGVAGYAATFVQQNVSNAAVFTPCDAVAGEAALRSLSLQPTARGGFIEKYRRDSVMKQLAGLLLQTAAAGPKPMP